jgi:hypothetical protein
MKSNKKEDRNCTNQRMYSILSYFKLISLWARRTCCQEGEELLLQNRLRQVWDMFNLDIDVDETVLMSSWERRNTKW